MSMPNGPSRAFTLVELIATVAILAVLTTMAVFFVGGYVTEARKIADKQTLAVLNDALTRYKCQGGDVTALTAGAPIPTVLARLKTEVEWAGQRHQFLQSSFTVPAHSLFSKGDRHQYRFTKFNTSEAESGGFSPGDLGPNGGNLIGWWKLDAVNGATDLSGNGHHGTAQGGVSLGTEAGHDGSPNAATIFDGVDDVVRMETLILTSYPHSICLWIRPALRNASVIHQIYFQSTAQFYLWETSSSFYVQYYNNNNSIPSGVPRPADQWYHMVVTVDVNRVARLYINGTQVSGPVTLTATSFYGATTTIGLSSAATSPFKGIIDDIRVYNRALSAAEVAQLYGM